MYWSLFLICMSTHTLIAQDFTKQISYINTLSEKNLVDEWMPIWEYYSLNPIDLNNTEELEKLMKLQLLTEIEFRQIKTYCQKRELKSIYELQGLGINKESLKRIKKFICVNPKKSSSKKSIKTSFQTSIKYVKSSNKESSHKYYTGSKYKTHFRLKLPLNKEWKIGLNWEKDSGEPIWYKHKGPNNLTGHIVFNGGGKLNKILFGKYDLNLGEGLLFGTSYRINNPFFLSYIPKQVTRESLSSKEYHYFQGICLEWKIKSSKLDLFVSHRKPHGEIHRDKTGLFRTPIEISKRKKGKENILGVSYSSELTMKKINWAAILYQSNYLKNRIKVLQSIYTSFNFYNINYSSEFVLQDIEYWATLHKLTISVDDNSLVSLQYRNRNQHIFNEYRSDYGNYSNGYEKGFLYCFQHNFDENWHFKATFDHFYPNFDQFEKVVGRKIFSEISCHTDSRKLKLQFQNKTIHESSNTQKFKFHYREYLSETFQFTIEGKHLNKAKKNNSMVQSYFCHTSSDKRHKFNFSQGVFHTINQAIFYQAPYFYGIYNSRFMSGKGKVYSISYQRKLNKQLKYGVLFRQMNYAKPPKSHENMNTENLESEIYIFLKWQSS